MVIQHKTSHFVIPSPMTLPSRTPTRASVFLGSVCGPKHFPSMKEVVSSFLNSDILPTNMINRSLSVIGGQALQALEAFKQGPGSAVKAICHAFGQTPKQLMETGLWGLVEKNAPGHRAMGLNSSCIFRYFFSCL